MRKGALSLVFASIWVATLPPAAQGQSPLASWVGEVRDASGNPLAGAVVVLLPAKPEPQASGGHRRADRQPAQKLETTDTKGRFDFSPLPPNSYSVVVRWRGQAATLDAPLVIHGGEALAGWLEVSSNQRRLIFHSSPTHLEAQGNAGERLLSQQVSALPLNKRDFSQLLLLAAGTMTDINGAANFTQQFAINGQRGITAVFAIDGIDTTDPELGGATFANFNVDAIQEIRSDSGVMPATVGFGAAGFTNVITKSGASELHGALFEFFRNAALDARNYFDRKSIASPGRLPPFRRNEFGFTNGGPVVLPGIYNGKGRTYYFGQYQGFRQVLGTTQVFPVPTREERQGLDTTTFAGDTIYVPVSPLIAPILARYPIPNDVQGPYGARTYSTSSRVMATSDQFSVRLDHRISDQGQLFARFNFNNVTGPTTNPAQTAIDPSFAVLFFDHQRNFGLTYTRAVTSRLTWESTFGFLRSTPIFSSPNHTQPGLLFADGLYEPFNSAAGNLLGAYGNLFQVRQNFSLTRGAHSIQTGFEAWFNRDTTLFGFGPNGSFIFGGGTAYAPVDIRSASGLHDIPAGAPLPDALTGFLTAAPFAFNAEEAVPPFPSGDHIGESAMRRGAFSGYFQDAWKASPKFVLNYGLRYEVNSRMHEAHHLTANPLIIGPAGQPARYWDADARQIYVVNPQPPYVMDWRGWGPRLSANWRLTEHTTLRAGAGITTVLPNLFQDDFLTGGFPFTFATYFTAARGMPLAFQNAPPHLNLPPVFTPQGQPVFATGRTTDVPPNTEIDLDRFGSELAAATPGHQIQPLVFFGMSRDFRNGYIENFNAGLEHDFGDVTLGVSYVGSAGVRLASVIYPNAYGGADANFARFTRFDAAGRVIGGLGPEYLMNNRSHSTFHSLQAEARKTSPRAGLGFQVSYTFSKSLDDTSNVLGGLGLDSSGVVLQGRPQDPRNPGLEKGLSNFDLTHVIVFNLIQALPLDRVSFLRPLGRRFTSGWQLLNISTLTSGTPFSVFSGIQQTGAGLGDGDRPDLVGQPILATDRKVREDYFGRGMANGTFFSIPIGVPGGTGPNQGRIGTLGRNTFRGPAFENFDVALIKDTPFGHRGAGEAVTLQLRAEFFNVFNLVNFGLPANILRGTGFGAISRTAGTSRQVQFSIKVIY